MKGFEKIKKKLGRYRFSCLCGIWLAAVMTVFVPAVPVYAENEFAVTEAEGTAAITAESLNVRSGPGKEYDVIGKAKAGEEFAVSGQTDNGWYRIAYGGEEGYVSGEYADVSLSGEKGQGEAADIPDEERAPIPGIGGIWQKIKAGGFLSVIAFILIPIVLVAIGFTVRSMRREADEGFGEDEEDDLEDGEEDDFEDGGEDDFQDSGYMDDAPVDDEYSDEDDSEEDYADEEESSEAYLSREVAPFIEEEEALREAEKELAAKKEKQERMQGDESDAELKQAMEKLAELQEEIERIKQKKES